MEASVDNEVIVNAVGTVEVAVGNAANAVVADDHALDITVTKKEYKIVGDEVYIAKLYEDAPQWMKDLVQLVVDNTMETESAMLRNDLIKQLNRFATSYVPLNTYTQSILDLSNADTAMHATLETLNSNFNDGLDTANSQIIDLQSTKASKTEVATKVIETLTAQLATPTSELGATIGNLQQTIVDGDSANADSVTTLMSVLEGEVDARASAIETINTYVGIDEAGASTGTGLSAYLEGSDGTIGGADSQVANSVAIVGGVPTSKWQYNSTLVVNGVTYNSGFGLSNSAGTGIGSEFWIDASRFKFTNSAKTGSTAPFTIDASGATPQITFNGKVSFSNVTGSESLALKDMSNVTTIDGGKITTGSITADKINTNSLVAENIRSTSVIEGNTIIGANIQGASIVGAVIKASYIDLDGDLEVLTDYHISTAMYNSNPAFYTDAVYTSGTNEYRLPTLSTISITTDTYSAAMSGSEAVNYGNVEAYSNSNFRNKVYPSPVYSYNVSNVGSNMKFRRIRPYVTLAATDIYVAGLLSWSTPYDDNGSNDAGAYHDMYFYIGDTLILHFYGGSRGTVGITRIGQIYVSGSFGTIALWNGSMWNSDGVVRTVTSYGLTFTIEVYGHSVYYTNTGHVKVTLNEVPTMTQLPFDVVNGNIRIINGDNTFLSSCTVKTPQIVCNNML